MKRPSAPQLGLFGNEVTKAPARDEVATHIDEEERALAAQIPSSIRFGTSSWTFQGWNNIVYSGNPTQAALVRSGLRAYARHPLLRTVGIDRSYYAPLTAEDLDAYREQLPPGFLAVSKVFDEITTFAFPRHPRYGAKGGTFNPDFLNPDRVLAEVVGPYEHSFREFTGPFVFEIAPIPEGALPSPELLSQKIGALLERLPKTFRYSFELRNQALLTPRYLDTLKAHSAGHVINYWTAMPTVGEQLRIPGIFTSDFVVVRLMLPPFSRYEEQKTAFEPFDRVCAPQLGMRADVLELLRRALDKGIGDTFVLANNKAEGSSPLTLKALVEEIAKGALTRR